MNTITPLEKAFQLCGGPYGISKICGIKHPPVFRWRKRGRLPDTEYLPEGHPRRTDYAERIEAFAKGAITKAELLSYIPPKPDLTAEYVVVVDCPDSQ